MKSDKNKKKNPYQWVMSVFCLAVVLSAGLSLTAGAVLDRAALAVAVFILLFFIVLGIVFDMVGVAVTAADERPFHSMAAHKEKGAKEALLLLKNANRVSSICNDVVGDICGIVSGTTGAVIVVHLQHLMPVRSVLLSAGVTALVSGLTIGGKALCKTFAMRQSVKVVYFVGRLLHLFHR